jgi:hypothetical protein
MRSNFALLLNIRKRPVCPPISPDFRRLPLLKTARARDVFVQALGEIRERYKFLLVGYAVMPDDVHLLGKNEAGF